MAERLNKERLQELAALTTGQATNDLWHETVLMARQLLALDKHAQGTMSVPREPMIPVDTSMLQAGVDEYKTVQDQGRLGNILSIEVKCIRIFRAMLAARQPEAQPTEKQHTSTLAEPGKYTVTAATPPLYIKPNYSITFSNDSGVIGAMDFNGPKFKFTGNAEESAKIFMDWAANSFSSRFAQSAKDDVVRKAVLDYLPYIENLILPLGHESAIMREHPAPCVGHDFCLMRQAQKGADAIRAAIAQEKK